MKKLAAIISGAFLAGAVNAQGTVELTSAQMDQVTAGAVAAGGLAFGEFFSINAFTTIATSTGGAIAETFEDGSVYSFGFAESGNTTAVLSVGAGGLFNSAASYSEASVVIQP